MTCDQR